MKKFRFLSLMGLAVAMATVSFTFTACGDDDDNSTTPVVPTNVDSRVVGDWVLPDTIFTPHAPSLHLGADGNGWMDFNMKNEWDEQQPDGSFVHKTIQQIERRGGTYTVDLSKNLMLFTWKYFWNKFIENGVDMGWEKSDFPEEDWYTDSVYVELQGDVLNYGGTRMVRQH